MMFSVRSAAFACLSILPLASGLHFTSVDTENPQIWASTTGGNGGVRKIIHQTWKTNELPGKFRKWSESWKNCLPEWEYRLHTDSENRDFIAKHFPEFLDTYDGYDAPIKRVDAVRYAYLAVEGGLYVDLDIECLRDPTPVFESMQGASELLVCEGCNKISNAIMATAAPSDMFRNVVKELPKYTKKTPLEATGPIFLSGALKQQADIGIKDWNMNGTTRIVLTASGSSAMLADDELFLAAPWNHSDPIHEGCKDRDTCLKLLPKAFSFSHWTGSWMAPRDRQPLDKKKKRRGGVPSCEDLVRALSGELDPADLQGPALIGGGADGEARGEMRDLLDRYWSTC